MAFVTIVVVVLVVGKAVDGSCALVRAMVVGGIVAWVANRAVDGSCVVVVVVCRVVSWLEGDAVVGFCVVSLKVVDGAEDAFCNDVVETIVGDAVGC